MTAKLRVFLRPAFWEYAAQVFVGLFFVAAAYHKAAKGFFGPNRVPLASIFQYWIGAGFPLEAYRSFLLWVMPWSDSLAVLVIVLQAILGLLLIFNERLRVAGILMLFVQGNIYLATYHHAELRVLGSQAMWLGIFYLDRTEMRGRLWSAMTGLLIFIGLLHLQTRYSFGDPWLSAVAWQRQHYIENVMAVTVFLKNWFIALTSGQVGAMFWASAWWLKLVLMLGVLTRYRLYFGAVWLALFTLIAMIWMNAWNVEGVFWVLILTTWMTHEYAIQKECKKPIRSLFTQA